MANMKKIMDERAKHRLVGVIVVLALMIIILPAMMRESDKNFDEFTSYHAPKPPPLPKVSLVDQHQMLRSVKVVSVALPKPGPQTHLQITPAQSLSPKASQDELVQAAKVMAQKQLILPFFDIIRVHLRKFAVQICFPSTPSKWLTFRSVLSSPSLNNFLDSVLRTSLVVEPVFKRHFCGR